MRVDSPCYGCKIRCLLCHAHCNEYAKYQAKLKEQSKRSKAEIEADTFVVERSDRIRRLRQTRYDEKVRGGY